MRSPNYITPDGARKLSDELNHLIRRERPRVVDEVATAAAHGDRSENAEYKYGKLKLKEIDRRIRFLQRRLDKVEVVDVSKQRGPSDVVRFGTTVVVEDEEGAQKSYQLVGEDESDPDAGKVSWRSPIGRALIKRHVGDMVLLRRPAGEVELEIINIGFGG